MNSVSQIPIIYEDSEIIIINKRAGLAVQGGKNITHSVDTLLRQQLKKDIYLVHRLDQETSGLLVTAKTPQAARKWTTLIREKSVVKEYSALVIGKMEIWRGKITDPLKEKGVEKPAVTFYETVEKKVFVPENISGEEEPEEITLSLLKLRLGTGRTHQIRLHLAGRGCPVCGDDLHGNFKMNKLLKKQLGIRNLLLCAYRLTLPLSGGEKVFEIPLPDYFNVL